MRESASSRFRRRGGTSGSAPTGGAHLFAFREAGAWHAVHAHLINDHLKGLTGASFSAKDFRTWNGTLLAAVSLATKAPQANSERARRRAIASATGDVAQVLEPERR